MFEITILVSISILLGMNMGVSDFAISFTPAYASGLVKKLNACIFYTIFVISGAVLIGPRVVSTLTTKISQSSYGCYSGLIIIISSAITLLIANLLKIPQSTSFIIVSAFTGTAFFYSQFNSGNVILNNSRGIN